MTVRTDLPCGYCCGAGPLCGSTDPDHEDMTCDACFVVPLSDPHPECLKMVDEYLAAQKDDPT